MKLSLVLSVFIIALVPVSSALAVVDEQIANIKQWYSVVEAEKNLKVTSFATDDKNEVNRATIKRYENTEGKVQKIYTEYSGQHGLDRTTYYFKDGELFFVYVSSNEWRFTGKKLPDGNAETEDIASQYRYYFHKGDCIKALEKRIALIGADELNELLKQEKSKEIEVVAVMNSYVKTAKALLDIKTKKDFTLYLEN